MGIESHESDGGVERAIGTSREGLANRRSTKRGAIVNRCDGNSQLVRNESGRSAKRIPYGLKELGIDIGETPSGEGCNKVMLKFDRDYVEWCKNNNPGSIGHGRGCGTKHTGYLIEK
jgi:hypothetical protein